MADGADEGPLPTGLRETVTFRARSLYHRPSETLVAADFHVGRAATGAAEIPVDDTEYEALRAALADAVSSTGAETVVFAGDVLHSFGELPSGVERAVRGLVRTCRDNGAEAVAVRGNHDALLDRAWPDGATAAARLHAFGDAAACHGDDVAAAAAATDPAFYAIGHDHPTLNVHGSRYPCFLYVADTPVDAPAIVLPAFNPYVSGVDVNGMRAPDFQSPFVTDAEAVYPIVYDADAGERFEFPSLRALQEET